MAFEDDAVEILRVLVDDTETPPKYTDAKLLRVLTVAAFQVLNELEFSQDFQVSLGNQTVTPDPTDDATRDDSLVNLVTLMAACVMNRGEAVAAAQRAIAVKDQGSAVDLRGVFGAKLQLLEKGWCAVYEDAKLQYQTGRERVAGAAVMTPFRLYAFSTIHRR